MDNYIQHSLDGIGYTLDRTTTLIYSTYKYRGSVVRTFTGHTLPSVQLQYKYTRNQILTWCENGFARYTESAGELFSCLKCTLLYLSLTGRCACSTFLSCLSHTHWQSHRYVCKRECVNIMKEWHDCSSVTFDKHHRILESVSVIWKLNCHSNIPVHSNFYKAYLKYLLINKNHK